MKLKTHSPPANPVNFPNPPQAKAAEAGGGVLPVIGGADAFTLYDTFGFPLEITQEVAADQGVQVCAGSCEIHWLRPARGAEYEA